MLYHENVSVHRWFQDPGPCITADSYTADRDGYKNGRWLIVVKDLRR